MPEEKPDLAGLALTILLAVASCALVTPLATALFIDRRPALGDSSSFDRHSGTLRPYERGDVVAITGRDAQGRLVRGEFRYGNVGKDGKDGMDGRTLGDLRRRIATLFPGSAVHLEDGRFTARPGELSLADAPGNRGAIDFESAAHDRRAANRTIRKTAHFALLLGFWFAAAFFARRRGRPLLPAVGLTGPARPCAWLGGFAIGAGTLAAFMVVATLFEQRRMLDYEAAQIARTAAKSLPLAFLIGILEDLAFFGFFLRLLGGRWRIGAIFFAATHFLHADGDQIYSGPDWSVGFEALGAVAVALGDIVRHPGEFLGLALIGGCLAQLRVASGHLWLGMGLHGGWYWARAVGRKICADNATALDPIFGSGLFYDGLFGWAATLATWFCAVRLARRFRGLRSAERD
ncbi:MAG: CPBP family intramembrane glutamic endopeptidase [Planctomycetota bacterium]